MVVAMEGTGEEWKHLHDPLDMDTTSCKMVRAKHPRDTIRHMMDSNEQQFLVWGRGNGPRGGLGNDLVFWPAVFVSSLLSGRVPVIDDISQPLFKVSTICKDEYLDCHIPQLSTIDQTAFEMSPLEASKMMITGTVREAITSQNRVLRVTGYHRHSNWWAHNATQAACVRKILNCTDIVAMQKGGRDICVERAAMSLLAGLGPGKGLKAYAKRLISRLKIGIKEKEQSSIFKIEQSIKQQILGYLEKQDYNNDSSIDQAYLFGTAVHMRFQFPSVETDGYTKKQRQAEATEWVAANKNFKLMDLLWNITMNTDDLALYTNKSAASAIMNDYTLMFISSDSEMMKEKIFEATLVNGTVLYRKLIPIYLPIHSNLTHLRHFEDIEIGEDKDVLPSIIFDWLMMSRGSQVVSYRGVHSHFQSTFSLSAAMYGAPIVFCEKAKHFVYKGKRLVFQRMQPHALDNF